MNRRFTIVPPAREKITNLFNFLIQIDVLNVKESGVRQINDINMEILTTKQSCRNM